MKIFGALTRDGMIVREITPILIIRTDESFKMMSNRIANVCLTNLCRRNISSTVICLQRKKKFTKAQVGFENQENFQYEIIAV